MANANVTVGNMSGVAVARTAVQYVLAKLLSSAFGVTAVTALAEVAGVDVNDPTVKEWIVNTTALFILGIVVWVINKFGKNFSWINSVISLGMSRTGPAYVPNNADAVVSTANPNGADTIKAVDTPPMAGPNDPKKV